MSNHLIVGGYMYQHQELLRLSSCREESSHSKLQGFVGACWALVG
jgi:hypothetical protein